MSRLPTLYLPHGGGPCFFMDFGPGDPWGPLARWLAAFPSALPAVPRAILVISAHWEAPVPTLLTAPNPPLLFDYYGFPPHTYQLTWPAPGASFLVPRVRQLLDAAGIPSAEDPTRGYDHGVFVPLKVSFPNAEIPTLQLSLRQGLDPAAHQALGRALAPLRDEGVLILGSGLSFHNMQMFQTAQAMPVSERFDAWLAETVTADVPERTERLNAWASVGRLAHPREEHLLPLMVVAGAAGHDRGTIPFRGPMMGALVSAVQFG